MPPDMSWSHVCWYADRLVSAQSPDKDSGLNTQWGTDRVLFLKEKTYAAVRAVNGSTNPVYHTIAKHMITHLTHTHKYTLYIHSIHYTILGFPRQKIAKREDIFGCDSKTAVLHHTVSLGQNSVNVWNLRFKITLSQCDCYYDLRLLNKKSKCCMKCHTDQRNTSLSTVGTCW